jgi:hypothetical protein
VSFVAWMLAFHLLAAFAVAASLVLFSVLVYAGRRMTTLEQTRMLFRLAPVGSILVVAGLALVLVFGVILALDTDGLHIWDGWVIAGIVLWAAAGGIGQRTGAYYDAVQKLAEAPDADESAVFAQLRAPTGALLHAATVGLFVLILLDMIFKPGA